MSEFSHEHSPIGARGALDDYVTWLSGGTPAKANPKYWSGDIPWVTPKDMKFFEIADTSDHLTTDGVAAGSRLAPASATYVVVRGMILAHTFPASQMARPAAFNQDIKAVVPGPDLLPRYLAYWFQSRANDFLRLVGESTHGTKKLDLPDLRLLPMDLPSLTDQEKIIAILTALDDQIRLVEKVVDKYRTQKQGLVDDIVFRAVGRAADGGQGWSSALLGSIVRENDGFIQTGPFGSQLHAYDYANEGVFVVMPQDIIDDRINLDSIAQVRDSMARRLARHRMNTGDVVFARRGDLGRCAEITQREQAWLCGTGCLLVRPPPAVLTAGWLALVYRHELGQRYVRARAVGSTMSNLNGTILAGLRIPLPPLTEQQAAVSAVNAQERLIDLERGRLAKLRAIKLGLLTDLLTGRVRVPQESSL